MDHKNITWASQHTMVDLPAQKKPYVLIALLFQWESFCLEMDAIYEKKWKRSNMLFKLKKKMFASIVLRIASIIFLNRVPNIPNWSIFNCQTLIIFLIKTDHRWTNCFILSSHSRCQRFRQTGFLADQTVSRLRTFITSESQLQTRHWRLAPLAPQRFNSTQVCLCA